MPNALQFMILIVALCTTVAEAAPVACASRLAADLPDLSAVDVEITPSASNFLRDLRLSEDWLREAIDRSRREPFPITNRGEPNFLLFLPIGGSPFSLARLVFSWAPLINRITVTWIGAYHETRDKQIAKQIQISTPLRHVRTVLRATDFALRQAESHDISLARVVEAVARPVARPIKSSTQENEFWYVGTTVGGDAVQIQFRLHHRRPYLTGVSPAAEQSRRTYFTQLGIHGEVAEDRKIRVVRGRFAGLHVSFGLGIETKITRTHDLTRAEVIEALELARDPIPDVSPDRGERQRGRTWFVSELAGGRFVKVVLVEENGTVSVVSAFTVKRCDYSHYLTDRRYLEGRLMLPGQSILRKAAH